MKYGRKFLVIFLSLLLIIGGQSFTFAEDTDNIETNTFGKSMISAVAEPSAGGSIGGQGEYWITNWCTLTAIPNPGYTFDHWEVKNLATHNFEVIGNSNIIFSPTYYPDGTSTVHFLVVAPREFKAVFTINSYNLSYVSNDVNMGTVSGTALGIWPYNTPISMSATAISGYRFVNWTEVGSGDEYSRNITLNFNMPANDVNLVANFEPIPMRHVTTVTDPSDTAEIVGGNGFYLEGSTITITVIPENGYWFEYYSISPEPKQSVNSGIELMKNSNYWSQPRSFDIVVPEYDITVTAHMYELLEYNLNLSVSPEDSGTAVTSGIYEDGETVTITATANRGFRFDHWEFVEKPFVVLLGDTTIPPVPPMSGEPWIVNSNPYTFIMPWYELNGIAIFEPIEGYNVELIADPTNGGTLTGAGLYYPGEEYTITATAAPGYRFNHWSWEELEPPVLDEPVSMLKPAAQAPVETDAVYIGSDASLTFTMGERDRVYTAHFDLIPSHVVNLIADPVGTGVLTGSGSYLEGESYIITATPNTGYLFSHWSWDVEEPPVVEEPTSNGMVADSQIGASPDVAYTSDQASLTGVMGTQDITYTAHFIPVPIVNGTVTVRWTHNSMNIVTPEVMTGVIGTPYATVAKVFPNYTLNAVPTNQNGVYVEGNIVVEYQSK